MTVFFDQKYEKFNLVFPGPTIISHPPLLLAPSETFRMAPPVSLASSPVQSDAEFHQEAITYVKANTFGVANKKPDPLKFEGDDDGWRGAIQAWAPEYAEIHVRPNSVLSPLPLSTNPTDHVRPDRKKVALQHNGDQCHSNLRAIRHSPYRTLVAPILVRPMDLDAERRRGQGG